MEFREMMWDLFISTGNLNAYLAYRACVCPDLRSGGQPSAMPGAYYQEKNPFGFGNRNIHSGGEYSGGE